MKILNYSKPTSVEEAYELLQADGTVIGGGAWLKLLPKTIQQAVDLSNLKLDTISEADDEIHIGSMVTLREMESNPLISDYLGGLLKTAIGHVMGVPFRNIATIGGTVVGRFGFSDILTPLLAADVSLEFHHNGLVPLKTYMSDPFKGKDILLRVILKKKSGLGVYKTIKKTSNDFPIINLALVKDGQEVKLSVGSRPGAAVLVEPITELLMDQNDLNKETIDKVIELVMTNVKLGSNSRGSEAYRREVLKTFVARGLKEVYR